MCSKFQVGIVPREDINCSVCCFRTVLVKEGFTYISTKVNKYVPKKMPACGLSPKAQGLLCCSLTLLLQGWHLAEVSHPSVYSTSFHFKNQLLPVQPHAGPLIQAKQFLTWFKECFKKLCQEYCDKVRSYLYTNCK